MIDDVLKGLFTSVTAELESDRCHNDCGGCTGGCHCTPGDPQTDSVCMQISHEGSEGWYH
jgi:hypothetical protein